jgi:dTMP kinase
MTGYFISFEGGEGCGKSTQTQLLCKAFDAAGISHIATREPGGSAGAEQIRKLLVSGDVDSWDADTETLLFYAARLDHMNRLVRPALQSGKHVVCDRFVDSTRVYQGVGKGIAPQFIDMLHHLTLGNAMPDLTIMFDMDPKIGLSRAHSRNDNETRFESMELEFHQKIRGGFLSIAKNEPGRCIVLDAAQDKKTLHQQVIALVNKRCALNVMAADD